jgi:hypothetical protein
MKELSPLENLLFTNVDTVQNGRKLYDADLVVYLAVADGGVLLNYKQKKEDKHRQYIEIKKYRREILPDEVALYDPQEKNLVIGDRGEEFSPIEIYSIIGNCQEIRFLGINELPRNKYLPFCVVDALQRSQTDNL